MDPAAFWLGALVAGVLIAVLAEPKAEPAPADDALVLAADKALGEAMRGGDKSAARKLLSLQFTFIDANGKIHARKDFLADLKSVAAAPANRREGTSMALSPWSPAIANRRRRRRVLPRHLGQAERRLARADHAGCRLARQTSAGAAGSAAPEAKPSLTSARTLARRIPYRVRSPAEQDIVTSFQAIEKAIVAHDAGEWAKHIGDEFVLYGSGRAPMPKSSHIATIEREKKLNAAVTVSEIQSMRLSVYGDGAAMIASHVMPDNSRPPFRAARVWVKRNGQWQMVISVQTDIKACRQALSCTDLRMTVHCIGSMPSSLAKAATCGPLLVDRFARIPPGRRCS